MEVLIEWQADYCERQSTGRTGSQLDSGLEEVEEANTLVDAPRPAESIL